MAPWLRHLVGYYFVKSVPLFFSGIWDVYVKSDAFLKHCMPSWGSSSWIRVYSHVCFYYHRFVLLTCLALRLVPVVPQANNDVAIWSFALTSRIATSKQTLLKYCGAVLAQGRSSGQSHSISTKVCSGDFKSHKGHWAPLTNLLLKYCGVVRSTVPAQGRSSALPHSNFNKTSCILI